MKVEQYSMVLSELGIYRAIRGLVAIARIFQKEGKPEYERMFEIIQTALINIEDVNFCFELLEEGFYLAGYKLVIQKVEHKTPRFVMNYE